MNCSHTTHKHHTMSRIKPTVEQIWQRFRSPVHAMPTAKSCLYLRHCQFATVAVVHTMITSRNWAGPTSQPDATVYARYWRPKQILDTSAIPDGRIIERYISARIPQFSLRLAIPKLENGRPVMIIPSPYNPALCVPSAVSKQLYEIVFDWPYCKTTTTKTTTNCH